MKFTNKVVYEVKVEDSNGMWVRLASLEYISHLRIVAASIESAIKKTKLYMKRLGAGSYRIASVERIGRIDAA